MSHLLIHIQRGVWARGEDLAFTVLLEGKEISPKALSKSTGKVTGQSWVTCHSEIDNGKEK